MLCLLIVLCSVYSLLGDWPNTYTFTKALAEQVVEKEGKGLPIAVFRPAVGESDGTYIFNYIRRLCVGETPCTLSVPPTLPTRLGLRPNPHPPSQHHCSLPPITPTTDTPLTTHLPSILTIILAQSKTFVVKRVPYSS